MAVALNMNDIELLIQLLTMKKQINVHVKLFKHAFMNNTLFVV